MRLPRVSYATLENRNSKIPLQQGADFFLESCVTPGCAISRQVDVSAQRMMLVIKASQRIGPDRIGVVGGIMKNVVVSGLFVDSDVKTPLGMGLIIVVRIAASKCPIGQQSHPISKEYS
jgi:hypothetical protein